MKINAQLNSNEVKKTKNYFKASVISISIGVILTMLLVSFLGANPFLFFIKTFDVVLTRTVNLQTALSWFATYALFGLGLAIGFKIGLFNMSGSGQAIFSMGLTGYMLFSLFKDQASIDKANSSFIILVLIIMIAMSMILSSTVGVLKVFFNIHEVATSILLNWTVWFIFKGVFVANGWNSSTPAIPGNWVEIGGLKWLLPFILTAIIFISVWLVLSYTTVGYKFKLVGTQKDAARYIGVNYKRYIISATAVQGLCIGLGSFVYWCAIKRSYALGNDLIPTIGFDAIAISLLAFNNVLGILPISLLWGILNVGMTFAVPSFPELGREISPLVFGFVVYSSTFVSLFIRFRPINMIKFMVYYHSFDIKTKNEVNLKLNEIKKIQLKMKNLKANKFEDSEKSLYSLHNKIMELKNNKSSLPRELTDKFALEKNEAILILKRRIDFLKDDVKELKEKGFEKFSSSSYKNIKASFTLKGKQMAWNLLNPAVKELSIIEDKKIALEIELKDLKKPKINEIKLKQIEIKELQLKMKNLKAIEFEEILILKKRIDLLKIEIKKLKTKDIEKINALKNQLQEIKSLETDLNQKWEKIIGDLKSDQEKLFSECARNLKSAKEDLKQVLDKKGSLSKEEFKAMRFESLMKLGEKYGCS